MPLAHQRIRPFLWFQSQASEAVDFYLSIFPNSRRNDAFTPGESQSPLVIPFELDGQPLLAFNGGPPHVFNEAISSSSTAPIKPRSTATGPASPKAAKRSPAAGARTSSASAGRSSRTTSPSSSATPAP